MKPDFPSQNKVKKENKKYAILPLSRGKGFRE